MAAHAPLVLAGLAGLGFLVSAGAQDLKIPWQEKFDSPQLGPAWSAQVSEGAKVGIKEGWVTMDADVGARAHLQRSAGVDQITLSAKIIRWGGVYLVWDADNWCGVGKVSPTPFGRFYSIDVQGGHAREADHRGVDFNLPHRLRVQLAKRYVRFEYKEGDEWLPLRTIMRPKGFTGAPRLIAAGKYYGAEGKPFSETAAPAKSGTAVNTMISDLRVEATGKPGLTRAQLKAACEASSEPVNALLQQSEEDPTFEQVAKWYPPMKSPREVVGVPAHPRHIGVDHLGRLEAGPWGPPLAWFEFGNPPTPLGGEGLDNAAYFTWDRSARVPQPRGASTLTRRLLHGCLPVLALSRNIGGSDCEVTVFGWSEGFAPDQPLFAYVRLAARTSATNASPGTAAMLWAKGGQRSFNLAAARGGAQCCFRFEYPKPASVEAITPEAFDSKQAEVAAHWQRRLEPAIGFDVPDTRVTEAYRAWLVYSMLNADTVNGYLEPHDGAGFYEEMFGNSVSLHTMALDLYGFHEMAARILDTQMHFQQPDGLYTQACGLVDPGGFLAGLARHYAITGDAAWLQRVSPSLLKQCEWLLRQREAAPRQGALRGLIKFRPYNDYPDPVYNYLGNAWCAQGMALTAAALKDIAAPQADSLAAAAAAAYRQDILDSMEVSAITRDGQTILPMEPDTQRMLKLSKYRGGDYYGLVASPLLGTGLLPPDDKRARWIVDMIEKRGGLIAGVCEFEGGIDHAYTYGYLMNTLQRGETRKTLLGFWSFLAFGMTRDTYSPVEVSMNTTGENQFTLPHLYSCTEQLRLLRNLLVREEADVLWIGQGIPRAWLAPGKHVGVTGAPTEFGPVSYRLEPQADGTLRITLDPPLRRPPGQIRICLRDPQKRKVAAVEATPAVPVEVGGDSIILPQLRAPVDLRVRFQARNP